MNRRAILAGLPAAVLGSCSAQTQEAESPVMVLFREWKVAFYRVDGLVTDGWSQARIDTEVGKVFAAWITERSMASWRGSIT